MQCRLRIGGNTLLHAGETAAVAWRLHGDLLHIGVADSAAPTPAATPQDRDSDREGGRGLFLVDLLTESWGVRPLGALGQEVWCRLRLNAA